MKFITWKLFWMIFSFQCVSTYRLDRNIVPTSYMIDIYVDKNLDYFLGNVKVYLEVDEPRTHVSLHFKRIKIISVYLNKLIKCTEYGYNATTEVAQFECSNELRNGDYLNINYKGFIATENCEGFFNSTYNSEKTILTQLKPGYARRLFPCFDEPFFKALFNITVTYPKNYKVWTNTQLYETNTISNYFKTTSFQTTPKMSTYLVAVVISQVESAFQKDQIGDGYNFNIYTRSGFRSYVGLSMKYGKEITDAIGSWTQIDYGKMGNKQLYMLSLPKLSYGAMENWGLIIFKEQYFFDEGSKSTTSNKEYVIYALAHEIAHQWFGNYVTIEWWSDLWIQEGLVTYISTHIFSKVFNYTHDFEREKQFVVNTLNDAFALESLPESTPLCVSEDEIKTINQAARQFNTLIYKKGASIFRMITYLIGMQAFRQAIISYLDDRQYSTATTSILLGHLANAAGQDPKTFATKMNAWIYEKGYPIVTALLDTNTSEVVLTQKPFYGSETQWYIPISYTTSSEKNFIFNTHTWLEPKSTLRIPFNNSNWIIFNLDVAGFYRVKYDTNLLDRITAALKGKDKYNIGPLNKAQLIYDLFNMAAIGEVNYTHVFNLLDYLRHEPDYYPWYATFSVLDDFFYKIDYESQLLLKERIVSYIEEATSDETNHAIYVNEHIHILKKNMMQKWACKMGQTACIEYAKTTFKSESYTDYDLRDMAFCYALKHSTNVFKDYESQLDTYGGTFSPLLKRSIFVSLGCISDSEALWKLLNKVKSDKLETDWKIRLLIFNSILANDQTGFRFTFDFIENHLPGLKKMFFLELANTLIDLHEKLFTVDQKIRFQNIMRKFNVFTSNVQLHMTNRINENVNWANKYGGGIKSALKSKIYNNIDVN